MHEVVGAPVELDASLVDPVAVLPPEPPVPPVPKPSETGPAHASTPTDVTHPSDSVETARQTGRAKWTDVIISRSSVARGERSVVAAGCRRRALPRSVAASLRGL